MKDLEELELKVCTGEVTTILAAVVPNISILVLDRISENILVQQPFTKLKELKVWGCRGELSSLLTQAAPFITSLDITATWECFITDMSTLVGKPFNNLKVLIIRELMTLGYRKWFCKEIDITASPLLIRGGRLKEFGNKVKRTWMEDYV